MCMGGTGTIALPTGDLAHCRRGSRAVCLLAVLLGGFVDGTDKGGETRAGGPQE